MKPALTTMLLWVCGVAWTLSAQPEPVRTVPFRQAAPPPTPKPTPKVFVALPNYDEKRQRGSRFFWTTTILARERSTAKWASFSQSAHLFQHAHVQRETGVVDQSMLDQVPQTFTTYTIKADDLAYVGNLPTAHEEQAS